MNITTVDALRNLGVRGDYLEFGSGAMKAGHKDAGTNRLGPGFDRDAPTIEAFIHLGNRLAGSRTAGGQGPQLSHVVATY